MVSGKKISKSEVYNSYPAIKKFLLNIDLRKIECGRYDLENGIWANVEMYNTQMKFERQYEAHRKYIDLHWIVYGSEIINVCDIDSLLPNMGYNAEKDIQFYHSSEGIEYMVMEEEGILLYPHDAHRTCISLNENVLNEVKKIVFKIPICYSKRVKCIIMDVDGTLTDGKIYAGIKEEYIKAFDVKDGYAIKNILPQFGIMPCVVTGRKSEILVKRCNELGITELYQGVEDKKDIIREIVSKYSFDFSELMYVGDDINDCESMKIIRDAGGITACPKDSVEDVLRLSNYISRRHGGNGAVREIIDWLVASVRT